MELDSFFLTNPQEGIGCPSAPLSRGPDRVALEVQGTTLNVAPVSTKYLSWVNLSVRKMSPAFAEKCMAVAVACVDVAAKPVRVRRLFSFLTKHRVKCTCETCGHSSCEIYTHHCQGFETNRSQGGKEGNFWSGLCRSFSRSSFRLLELGSYFSVS
jgi:hypothetical protein